MLHEDVYDGSKEHREKKFCRKCGWKLVPDDRISGYDEYTGAPLRPFLFGDSVCSNVHCEKNPKSGHGQ